MDSELRSMVMAFRVTELQTLLGFAGKNKTGRKNELQARCLDLVKSRSPQIMLKIKDLYKSIQMSTLGQPLANIGSGAAAFGATTASSLASRSYGSGGYAVDCPKDGNYVRGQFGFQKGITVDGQYRNLPICPDVSMKKLPFFDIIAVLLRPQSLLPQGQSPKQETQHTFCLTPSQAGEISKSRDLQITQGDTMPMSKLVYSTQIQLRFCALDTSEEQDDLFPPNLSVKVNSRPIQLPHPIPSNRPGVEPKRPSRPLNVTNNVKLCPHTSNSVQISWLHDTTRNYAVSMYIVKKLTADELLLRLKNKRIQPADFTRGRIKEITTAEEEDLCAPTSIRVSIACPLGKSRMTWPCRGTTCKHLQCFDANLFLLMNEKKPSFICPVCNKHLKFEDLSIDGYFMDVIKNLSIDSGNEIELYADGTWTPAMKIKKEIEDVAPPPKRIKTSDESTSSMNNTIDVDDDICIVEDVPGDKSMSEKSKKTIEPEIIDLIDSSDEEEETTPMYNSNNNSQEAVKPKETEKVNPDPPEEEDDDDDDDDEEVGIRPRRRKPRINYVEDSSSDSTSTNEGVVEPSSPSKARSPACIELSDSPTPSPPDQRRQNYEQQRTTSRAFQSVSNQSSASRAASSVNNSRSGSGSSTTLYSSSVSRVQGSGMPTNPVGHGGPTMTHPNVQQPDYFSRSSSVSMSTSSPAIISPPPSSLLYPPSHAHGYSYDGMSGWEDLSYMNPANFAQVNLNFDYLNSTHGYTPGPGGGGGYPWM